MFEFEASFFSIFVRPHTKKNEQHQAIRDPPGQDWGIEKAYGSFEDDSVGELVGELVSWWVVSWWVVVGGGGFKHVSGQIIFAT